MAVSKIGTNALSSGLDVSSTNISYTGTLTGGTGVVNIGSGQVYKDASGNVGIGTSSPTARLTVVTAGTNQGEIRVSDNATYYGAFARVQATDEVRLGSYGASQNLTFYTVSSERARIDSSGNFIISGSNTFYTNTASFSNTSGTGKWSNNRIELSSGSTAASDMMYFRNANGIVGAVGTNGSSTYYNTSSDYRLKHDIQPMTGALARVAALKPVKYKWNSDDSNGEGFIAHELQAVVPQCVTGEKDAVNEDGSIKPQGIDTSFLVATLTAAIQELKAELDSVKAELAVLKGV